ncbi:MAG TPA: EamA family transporter, partial [Alphaproteobacteria bacterium]|nr:EamA family transporter [Alphaproteobacteria bacterium]
MIRNLHKGELRNAQTQNVGHNGRARRIGAVAVNLLRLPIAWVLLSAALALTGTPLAGLDGQRVTLLALSGLLGLTLGDLALFRAMVRIGPRLSSLLMALAPAFATLA